MKKLLIVSLLFFLFLPAISFAGTRTLTFGVGGGTITISSGTTAAGANTDSFTGADGTALATHNANWVSMDATNVVSNCAIQSNMVEGGAWVTCGAMYNASSSDSSQILFKADADTSAKKAICVRAGVDAGADKRGYCANFETPSAGNWTVMQILKGSAYLDGYSGTWSQAADHTIKIVASGASPVTLHVWIDGADLGAKSDSTSPYGTGKPGIRTYGNGSAADLAMDDWTDAP